MKGIYQKFEVLLQATSTDFKRYLYQQIPWENRLIGIIGARGVGKTTMVLQRIKEELDTQRALYASADDLYFSENKLLDLADTFYKNGGEVFFIDEIHRYPDWSRELKNMYDSFPELKIVFTGSSILDILKGFSDLSRRALIYKLEGLSFREYLNFFHNQQIEAFSLQEIIEHQAKLPTIKHPLPLFRNYLTNGYFPFGKEGQFSLRLSQVIVQTLETDIPQYASLSIGTTRKLKRLLTIIAESVPFKPNFSKIAELLGVSRNNLDDYFSYMEKAGLISQVRSDSKGIRGLGKVDKVFLDNPNLIENLVGEKADIGNVRETFFYNQMRVNHLVVASKAADFQIDDYTFEIGGKNKQQKQIKQVGASYLVKDDIEYGYQNTIPLWAFGLNY